MATICYPIESAFYPIHLAISFTTTAIFIVIIFSYRIFLRRTSDDRAILTSEGKMTRTGRILSVADGIALMTLIATIIVTGLLPIIQNPLVDYSAALSPTDPNNPQSKNFKLNIDIINYGLASANHLIVSVKAVDANVKFNNSQSTPYLSNHFNKNESMPGNLFLEIDTLPPRSQINMSTYLEGVDPDKQKNVIPYVRSDERVGFHLTIPTSLFYLVLGGVYVLILVYLVYWNRLTDSKNWKPLDKRSVGSIIFYIFVAFAVDVIGVSLIFIQYLTC
jgi:hypothetical protein